MTDVPGNKLTQLFISVNLLFTVITWTATAQHCHYDTPLGMINGEIRDWQIKSSTEYKQGGSTTCLAKYARLYMEDGYSWCPAYHGTSEWLEINLGVEATITGVATQGRGKGKEFVRTFRMAVSRDSKNWVDILDEYGTAKTFEGNTDAYQPRYNYLDIAVVAKRVRIFPQTYSVRASLRVELLGCQPCKTLLNSMSIRASSFKGKRRKKTCLPEYGHILSNKGWCSRKQNSKQYIEFDFGPPVKITGIVTKGRGDGRRLSYVSSFRIAYTNDTSKWLFYKNEVYLPPQDRWTHHVTENGTVFRGNADRNTENVHFLDRPFVARYARVHVLSWKNRVGLRAGFYGCPHVGPCGAGFFKPNPDSSCKSNAAFQAPVFVLRSRRDSFDRQRKRKRHAGISWWRVRPGFPDSIDSLDSGTAAGGVGGRCLELSQTEVPVPVIKVRLRKRQEVHGVYVYTGVNATGDSAEELQQLKKLKKIDVAVLKPRNRRDRGGRDNRRQDCGFVTNLNDALLRPRIHISCSQTVRGSSVYLKLYARGGYKPTVRVCNIVVY